MNTVVLAGNLTRDPEVRYLEGGKAVTNFTIALNERGRDGKEYTSFIRCAAWGDVGLRMADTIKSGMRVIIEGKLNQHTWTDKEGKKRDEVSVLVRSVDAVLRQAAPPAATSEVENDLPF